jgi:hypothetical protein
MKEESFFIELIKSFPFKVLMILVFLILMGVTISKCKEKKVQQMKEDVLYIQPKPGK